MDGTLKAQIVHFLPMTIRFLPPPNEFSRVRLASLALSKAEIQN